MSTTRRSFFKQLAAAIAVAPLVILATDPVEASSPTQGALIAEAFQRSNEASAITGELKGYNRAVLEQYSQMSKDGSVTWNEYCCSGPMPAELLGDAHESPMTKEARLYYELDLTNRLYQDRLLAERAGLSLHNAMIDALSA